VNGTRCRYVPSLRGLGWATAWKFRPPESTQSGPWHADDSLWQAHTHSYAFRSTKIRQWQDREGRTVEWFPSTGPMGSVTEPRPSPALSRVRFPPSWPSLSWASVEAIAAVGPLGLLRTVSCVLHALLDIVHEEGSINSNGQGPGRPSGENWSPRRSAIDEREYAPSRSLEHIEPTSE
jgi:hypothetical protein